MEFTVPQVPQLTEFQFNGITYRIEKLKNYNLIKRFREVTLPILAAHFEPLERVITASSNEFLVDWEVMTTLVGAEIRIDRFLIPAYRIILESKGIKYKEDGELEILVDDIDELYAIIFSQIGCEKILETFIARKSGLLDELKRFMELPFSALNIFENKRISSMLDKLGVLQTVERPKQEEKVDETKTSK